MLTTMSSLSGAAAAAADNAMIDPNVTIFGLAVAVVALVVLILVMQLAVNRGAARVRAANKAAGQQTRPPAVPARVSGDLVAVIAAAVAASLDAPANGIVIRSISRARPNVPAWARSGRTEQIFSRL